MTCNIADETIRTVIGIFDHTNQMIALTDDYYLQ